MALEWGDNEISWGKFGQIITTSLRYHWKWSFRCRSWISQNVPCHWRLIDVDAFLMTRWPCWVQTRPQIDGWILISILPFNLQCFGECRPSLKHIHVAGKSGLGSKFGGRQVKKQWKTMAHVWAHVHMIDSFQSWIHPRFPLTHQSHWEIFDHNIEWCRHRIHWLIIIFPVLGCSHVKSSEVTMVWCLNQVKKNHVFGLNHRGAHGDFLAGLPFFATAKGSGPEMYREMGGWTLQNDVVFLRKKDDKSLELGVLPDKPNGFWCFGLVNFVWISVRDSPLTPLNDCWRLDSFFCGNGSMFNPQIGSKRMSYPLVMSK